MTRPRSDAALRKGIGKRVFYFRVGKRLTVTGLADLAGVHRNTINRCEAGKSFPSVPALVRLADALSVPVYSLIDEVK